MPPLRDGRAFSTHAVVLAIVCGGWTVACATRGLPPIETREALRRAQGLTGRLRVSIRAPNRRGRAVLLVGFQRPDSLRIEIPEGVGQRLAVIARAGRLCAVFPAERAVFRGPATADSIEAALGVALSPSEVMDLIAGAPPPRLSVRRARWSSLLPRELAVRFPDGTDLMIKTEELELVAPAATAFVEPALPEYRAIDAEQARALWEDR